MSRANGKQSKLITKGVLFCTPFLLFFAAVLCFVLWLNQYLLVNSEVSLYVDLLFRGGGADGTVVVGPADKISPSTQEGEIIEGEFVTPSYASQWATLNVDGWQARDLPVYYGNGSEVLREGVAQAQFSRFAGQNGKLVLSAHVNREFYEIEDAAARFENGEEVLVTLDTLWGTYVYRVSEVIIFGHRDATPLLPADGEESLFFYTCYPRENALAYKTERIGLQCELVSGATWEYYVNE
ncbi:MAG: sortase [Clostridia bacterium]|nr:sortase [Clostridia bacterium]